MVEFGKTADKWFGKIQADIGKKIENFVAFFFFMIAAGILIGVVIVQHYPQQAMLAVLFPAAAGIFAYYNRAFAVAVFVIMLILIFI